MIGSRRPRLCLIMMLQPVSGSVLLRERGGTCEGDLRFEKNSIECARIQFGMKHNYCKCSSSPYRSLSGRFMPLRLCIVI